MKLSTKVVTGMSVAAMSVLLVGGINAEAASIKGSKSIDSIAAGDQVSFDAVKNGNWNAKAKWDLYEKAGSADLSNLKTAKDTYIAIKGASSTDIYKIKADTLKKFKATCDGESIKIQAEGKDVSSTDITKYSWRAENSTQWTAFTASGLDLTPYTMQGATLYIRYMGAGASAALAGTAGSEQIEVPGETNKVTVKEIDADSFPAKEFKVKVPKKANAPAISVDYVKGQIKANKSAVYKTASALSGALSATWSEAKMASNYSIDVSGAGTFLMQVPADTAKGKPSSKIGAFTWKASDALTISYTKPTAATGTLKGDLIASKLSWESVTGKTAEKGNFVLKNTDTGVTYEFYDEASLATDKKTVLDGKKAVATVKPGATVKLTTKNAPDGTKLYVRVAGNAKDAKLPGQFATSAVEVVYFATPAAE